MSNLFVLCVGQIKLSYSSIEYVRASSINSLEEMVL